MFRSGSIILSAFLGVITGNDTVPTVESFGEPYPWCYFHRAIHWLICRSDCDDLVAAVLAGEKIATTLLGFLLKLILAPVLQPCCIKDVVFFLIVLFLGMNGHLVVIGLC